VKEKNIRIDAEVWELLKSQAKRLGRSLKGHIKVLAEQEETK
jgi:macrodomain Ter protein organizer (MatP/YcbG family)